jgi:RNA-binding protein
MKGKARAELRAEAHHLEPLVHVGVQGVTDAVLAGLDDCLRTRELVKIAVGRHEGLEPKQLAGVVAAVLGAEVIQVIGRKVTVYRKNPDLPHAPGQPAPWRR